MLYGQKCKNVRYLNDLLDHVIRPFERPDKSVRKVECIQASDLEHTLYLVSWYLDWYFADSVYIFVGNLHFSFYFLSAKLVFKSLSCLQTFFIIKLILVVAASCCCFESIWTSMFTRLKGQLKSTENAQISLIMVHCVQYSNGRNIRKPVIVNFL